MRWIVEFFQSCVTFSPVLLCNLISYWCIRSRQNPYFCYPQPEFAFCFVRIPQVSQALIILGLITMWYIVIFFLRYVFRFHYIFLSKSSSMSTMYSVIDLFYVKPLSTILCWPWAIKAAINVARVFKFAIKELDTLHSIHRAPIDPSRHVFVNLGGF